MKIIIDTDNKKLEVGSQNDNRVLDLFSKESFEILSEQWLKVGWNEKYSYTFSWFGRPLIQLPEDIIRIQELIYMIKPDVIIETGIAHGGSLIFYASLCKAMGKGKVIGIDIEIRPHNKKEIEEHELYSLITLIEGNSIEEDTLNKVEKCISKDDKVLVLLDSCHTREHVIKELELYSSFVTMGSYIVVEDGIMKDLYNTPNGEKEWIFDNPSQAAMDFIKNNSKFVLEQPKWVFDESSIDRGITYWPNAWLKKIK